MAETELSFRELHEKFMQNYTGTSVEENVSILTTLPFTTFVTVFLVNCMKFYLQEQTYLNGLILFIFEFILLVFPQIIVFMTPYYNYCYILLYGTSTYLMIRCILRCVKQCIVYRNSTIKLRKTLLVGKRPYITYFRTLVNLTTTICILAVDFTSFPRKFAKTENYGFSLMDTGVGYFVVCNAMVGNHVFKDDIYLIGRPKFLLKLIKQNVIYLILGLVRLVAIEGVNYQKHYSEYGVHWNFFISLGCTRIIALFILSYFRVRHVKYVAFFVIILHQILLVIGTEEWVLSDAPRDNLLLANREGVVSLLGYIGLYLASVELGNKLNAKSTIVENDLKLILQLALNSFTMYVVLTLLNLYIQCSRRLANIIYILWIIMSTQYLLFWCLLFEILLRFSKGLKRFKNDSNLVPSILESINYNALLYFLVANLLTGIINLCVETLYIPSVSSIVIVTGYVLIACSVVKFLHLMNIKCW